MTEKKEDAKGTINLSFAPKDVGVAVVGAYLAVTSTLNIGTASDVKAVVDNDAKVITKSVTENMNTVMSSVNLLKSQNDVLMEHLNSDDALKREYSKLKRDYSKLKNKCKNKESSEEEEKEDPIKAWLLKNLLNKYEL